MSKEDPARYDILLVDDDDFIQRLVKRVFKNTIFNVRTAGDVLEAMDVLDRFIPDMILLDLGLPGLDGEALINILREKGLDIPTLIISGKGDVATVRKMAVHGVIGYMRKPINAQELRKRVGASIMNWRATRGMSIVPLLDETATGEARETEIEDTDYDGLTEELEAADYGSPPEPGAADNSSTPALKNTEEAGTPLAAQAAVANFNFRLLEFQTLMEGIIKTVNSLSQRVESLEKEMRN